MFIKITLVIVLNFLLSPLTYIWSYSNNYSEDQFFLNSNSLQFDSMDMKTLKTTVKKLFHLFENPSSYSQNSQNLIFDVFDDFKSSKK